MLHFPDTLVPGSMAARVAQYDWAATPLGAVGQWSGPLVFAVNLALRSDYPMAIYWGDDFRLIYNDAWAEIPGERHPQALGGAAADVWYDIWDIVGPQLEQVRESGQSLTFTNEMLPMVRGGIARETYWNYSFSPIIGESGRVEGILNHGIEVTRTVLAERRLSFQVSLSDRLRGLSDPSEVKLAAAEMLGRELKAARCGYGQVDAAQQVLTIRRDWHRDEEAQTLAGQSSALETFGPELINQLKQGKTLIVEDCRADDRIFSDQIVNWDKIGMCALIVVPLMHDGQLGAILYVLESGPRAWKQWEVELAEDVAGRTWAAVERAETERLLRESEDHYRHAVELNPQVSWTATPDGQLNRVSKRWREWTGSSALGSGWWEGAFAGDLDATRTAWSHSIATGEPFDAELRIKTVDGSLRWTRARAFPRFDDEGQVLLWYGTTEDIHERKLGEERQRLLINELNHRVKNTLATVQAIAVQTLKGNISLGEAKARFESRLMTLSRAHNLLTEQNWTGADLRTVIEDAVAHLAGDGSRFRIDGPPLWTAPRAALAMSLAVHELSTNAHKYGSLSVEQGTVSIAWRVEGDVVDFDWKEHGGPPVEPPSASGFGSRLIERGISADLGGKAVLHFDPDGLHCRILASLAAVQARDPSLA